MCLRSDLNMGSVVVVVVGLGCWLCACGVSLCGMTRLGGPARRCSGPPVSTPPPPTVSVPALSLSPSRASFFSSYTCISHAHTYGHPPT